MIEGLSVSGIRREEDWSYAHPAFVANRLIESSLSALARTWPQRAKVVVVGRAFSSVLAVVAFLGEREGRSYQTDIAQSSFE